MYFPIRGWEGPQLGNVLPRHSTIRVSASIIAHRAGGPTAALAARRLMLDWNASQKAPKGGQGGSPRSQPLSPWVLPRWKRSPGIHIPTPQCLTVYEFRASDLLSLPLTLKYPSLRWSCPWSPSSPVVPPTLGCWGRGCDTLLQVVSRSVNLCCCC